MSTFADNNKQMEIKYETRFHELEEWSSLIGMSMIAMVKVSYNKTISGAELKACTTVEDVYKLISLK